MKLADTGIPFAQRSIDISAVEEDSPAGDSVRAQIAAAIPAQRAHFSFRGQELWFCYAGSSAVVSDGTSPPPFDPATYVPTARPGCRAPHMWIERDQEQLSTLDLWNGRWALIGGPRSDGWQKAAASAGIPTVMWGRDVIVDVSQFLELYGLADDGAVLVRPDGHVAWRSAAASENPEHQLAAVLAAVLHTTTTKDLT